MGTGKFNNGQGEGGSSKKYSWSLHATESRIRSSLLGHLAPMQTFSSIKIHTWREQRLALGGSGRVRLEKVSKVLDSLLHTIHLTVDMNNPCKK